MLLYLIPVIVFALIAILHKLHFLKLDKSFYAVGFFAIALFSGLRFEVGQDWAAYETFFNDIDLNINPISLYFSENLVHPQFEIGYHYLNYIIKYMGGTYSLVLLCSSLFCAYAVYRFTTLFIVNRFYILTIYFTHTFLILHFAQVRQAIAVGFFVLACEYYLKQKKMIPSLFIAMLGSLFQFTSLMYVSLLILIFWLPDKMRFIQKSLLFSSIFSVVLLTWYFSDFISILSFIAGNGAASEKVAIYKETQSEQGLGQVLYSVYLIAIVVYLYRFLQDIPKERIFIVKYAIISLLLTISFTFIFPGVYPMYSRIYVVANIFQAYALALVFAEKREWLHDFVFGLTLVITFISYGRMLYMYSEEYAPYNCVLGF